MLVDSLFAATQYAKSNRSMCQACDHPIAVNEVRIAKMVLDDNISYPCLV